MTNNIEIDIATAHSRMAKKWKNTTWKWADLVDRCRHTHTTSETAAEYARMPKNEQSNIKDVGGFVGGYLSGGTRKTASVMYRSCATLDIDYGTENVWEDFTLAYDFAAFLYSTHKHTDDKPRYRLVFPFNRQVSPAEYEAVCRRIAGTIGMDLFDDTTYELARLFYWPSTSKGAPYVFESQDGPACDVDAVLATYKDYRDVSQWPISDRQGDIIRHEMRKVGDPTEKAGLIGAFCREYSIEDAIDTFLSDRYVETAMPGRYTYKLGSVAAGLVCYDGKFAYSHHATDPAGGRLCNAFDLVRIHLYGVMDEGTKVTDFTRLPSYLKMMDFVAADKRVRVRAVKERQEAADADFANVTELDATTPGEVTRAKEDTKWMERLDLDKKGMPKPTSANIIAIIENDYRLKGHLFHDEFSGFDMVTGGLPWDHSAKMWASRDDANLRVFMEDNYGVSAKEKVMDAKCAVFTLHRRHPIREYLKSLKWDGIPRLDKMIIDFVGAEDCELNRVMTRKQFVAAVARVMNPGCKYDYCLTLNGKEGIGKSTLLAVMGGEWFNDSIITTDGKTGMENLQRAWLVEMAEMEAMRRSEATQTKAFMTRQVDIYRPAYGTVVENHPRQCVFFATTNEDKFLKGDTGNRRFWVISVDATLRTKTREQLIEERDQLWAEAVVRYKAGEKLFLDADLEAEARARQRKFNDNSDDPLGALLEEFLERPLPVEWSTMDLQRRRAYITNPDPLDTAGVEKRSRVCAAEFICERMGRDMTDKEYKLLARRVRRMMDEMPGWEVVSTSRHAEALYGTQRAYKRVNENCKQK